MATQTDAAVIPETSQSPSLSIAPQQSSNIENDVGTACTTATTTTTAGAAFTKSKAIVETRKFQERQHYKIGGLEYPRQRRDPGLIYIFNHENFNDFTLGYRGGSRRDVNELAICFQRLGYNITDDNIFTDLTRNEVQNKITEIAESDLSEYNSLIIFVLTHGDEFNTLYTKDGSISACEFWSKIGLNETLADRPKMFVFQACKGDGYSTTGSGKSPKNPQSSSRIVPTATFSTNYLQPHILTVYSSIEGNSTFRNVHNGTWFVQELCKNFSAYGRRDDVLSLLIRTTKCVCGNYYLQEKTVYKKQMPFFVSTLQKKFYLNTNRDRDALMRIEDDNAKILKNLKEIKKALLAFLEDKKK